MLRKIIFILILLLLLFNIYSIKINKIKNKRYVAILPFVNINQVNEYDYLSKHLIDALCVELSKNEKLAIIDNEIIDNQIIRLNIDIHNILFGDNPKEISLKSKADVMVLGKYIIIDKEILIQVEAIDIITNQIIASTSIHGKLGIDIFRIIDEVAMDMFDKVTKNIKLIDETYSDEIYKIQNELLLEKEKLNQRLKDNINVDSIYDLKNQIKSIVLKSDNIYVLINNFIKIEQIRQILIEKNFDYDTKELDELEKILKKEIAEKFVDLHEYILDETKKNNQFDYALNYFNELSEIPVLYGFKNLIEFSYNFKKKCEKLKNDYEKIKNEELNGIMDFCKTDYDLNKYEINNKIKQIDRLSMQIENTNSNFPLLLSRINHSNIILLTYKQRFNVKKKRITFLLINYPILTIGIGILGLSIASFVLQNYYYSQYESAVENYQTAGGNNLDIYWNEINEYSTSANNFFYIAVIAMPISIILIIPCIILLALQPYKKKYDRKFEKYKEKLYNVNISTGFNSEIRFSISRKLY
jgi:TolB-like protein